MSWWQLVKTVVIALLIVVLVRIFILNSYCVNSESMEDSCLSGDYVFVNKLAFAWSAPERGDVILFNSPLDHSRLLVKRIVGLPNDTVMIIDKTVYINGQILPDPPTAKHIDTSVLSADRSFRDNMGQRVVPANEYFVMGDNRDNSRDSRFWGCVPDELLIGKVLLVYLSLNQGCSWYNPAGWRTSRLFTIVR